MAEISVQVPVKNGGEGFRHFLQSLAVQDAGFSWELVIADDGSDSPVLSSYADELSELPDHCSVKVVRLSPGGNRPSARNAALEASEAPIAILMDADLSFPPGLLRGHMEARRETEADFIMGRRVNAWNSGASPWQKWMDTRAMGFSPAGPFPWKYFITGNLSGPCSLLRQTGGFDASMDRYGGEDTEMGFRLFLAGASFFWEPSLTVNHLDDVAVRKHSLKMLEYGSTGLRYTLKKHPGARGLLGSRLVEPLLHRPLYLAPLRALAFLLLFPAVYGAALRHAERYGGPGFLFTYLSVAACLAGLSGRRYRL